MTLSSRAPKRTTLNIRIRPDERGLIDRAARARGQNRTDFILEAARKAAEEALLDRTLIAVSAEAHAKFLHRLDAPPHPSVRLKRTLHAKAPWHQCAAARRIRPRRGAGHGA